MHGIEFLKQPDKHPSGPAAVIFGGERHLKLECLRALIRVVLGDGGEDDGLTRFDGKETDLATLCDELRTVSMWSERRLVVVEDADSFVSENRAGLERYLESPAKKSVLVLDVKSWPKNTRLARAVAKTGIDLECRELKGAALIGWLTETARERYGKRLDRQAAALMVELAGDSLGLLDQELAKLAAYVGEAKTISDDAVKKLVGGWRTETAFAMADAVRDGKPGEALGHLDKLLIAGEAPQRIMGGLTFVYRRLMQAAEEARQGTGLKTALRQAGVYPGQVEASNAYLRRLGRPLVERIPSLLLAADGNLKGAGRIPPRIVLERLLVELSAAGEKGSGPISHVSGPQKRVTMERNGA